MFIGRVLRVLPVLMLFTTMGEVLAQNCKSPPVATNDNLPWTGSAERLEVRANDYDPAGRTFTITGVVHTPDSGGIAEVCCDGQAVYFTPDDDYTEGSFSYTIVNSDGQTATALASLGKSTITLPSLSVDFDYSCDGLYCTFRSKPSSLVNVRAYGWEFWKRGANGVLIAPAPNDPCQKPEWHAQAFSCTFALAGEWAVYHRVMYHGGEVAVTAVYPRIENIVSTPPVVDVNVSAPRASLYVEARIQTSLSNPNNHHYKVDWGDGIIETVSPGGTTVNDTLLSHTYAAEGMQTVTIIHQESAAKYWQAINLVNKTPAPRLTASNEGAESFSFTIPFTGSSPADGIDEFDVRSIPGPLAWEWPPNAPAKWELDYGDGVVEKFNAAEIPDSSTKFHHDYPPRRGVYKARLVITDHLGATGVAEQEINVTNSRPVAQLATFCENGYCRFDGSQSTDDGSITEYRFRLSEWDPAGYWRTWATVAQPSPVYDVKLLPLRKFKVELTVRDDAGATKEAIGYGYNSPGTEAPLVYYAVEPCSLGSSQTFAAGTSISFIGKGVCGVPDETDVVAAAVNIRLSSPVYPGNLHRGGDAVVMNFNPSRAQQSSFSVLPYSTGTYSNELYVYMKQFSPTGSGGTANVSMDVVGYFRRVRPSLPAFDSGSVAGPLWYTAIPPCGLIDTRKEPPGLANAAPRLFDFRTRCTMTPDVVAAAMQMAIITPAANGSAVAFSAASPLPAGRSSIDVLAGRNLSSLVLSKVSNGMMKIASTAGSANTAITTAGYFTRDSARGRYYGVTPCRVYDSRTGIGSPLITGVPQRFQVGGDCGISRHATAVLVHAAVVAPGGQGYLQLYASGRDMPEPYAIANFLVNETIGSSAIVPLGGGVDMSALLTMFGGTSAHVVVDVFGYFDGRRNVASAANGATALTSDTPNPNYPIAAMIDGDRSGKGWGSGTGGWSDTSPTTSPDFVGIQFAAPARIDQVDLFTLPDDYANAGEPHRQDTFTKWGLTAFDIGYWDASAAKWVYFPVTQNNLRWSRVIFPAPVVTDKLSIVARSGCPACTGPTPDNLGGHSRIVEIEAYEVPAGTP